MKKLIKFCVVFLTVGFLLAGGCLLALRFAFPPEKVKAITLEYAKNTLHREVQFKSVSFNFIGITLTDFALSEENSFAQGTFLKAKKLHAKMAFWPLLKKRVEIGSLLLDGLDVKVVQRKDNSFNFSSLLADSAERPTQNTDNSSDKTPFVLTAQLLSATDCNLNYQNEQTGLTTGLNHLNIRLENFDLNKPFPATVSFVSHTQETNGPLVSIPVNIALDMFLAGLDLPKAYVQLTHADVAYKKITLDLSGKIENFENPAVNLTGSLSGLNHSALADLLPDLPAFSIPQINLSLQATTNLQNASAQIQQASLRILNNALDVNGILGWGETSTYHLNGKLQADLAQVVQMAQTKEFSPQGNINGSFSATDKKEGKDFSGTFTLKNLSALYPPFTLTQTNGILKIASLDNISGEKLTGLLNGENFNASFAYRSHPNATDLELNLQVDKLTLDAWPASDSSTDKEEKNSPAQNTPENYLNLTANLTLGPVQVPYFRADGITLNTALKNINASMKQANGTISFSVQPGAITDIEKLMKQNKIVRIILLPLNLLNAVGKKLNLDLFDSQTQSKKGEIALTKGEGHYTFTNGLMQIDATTFETALTNLNASGTIDFPADKINMKASATLVTKQTPVVFKITGPVGNPSGKLDITHTVGSVLEGILNYKNAKTATQQDTAEDTAQTTTASEENAEEPNLKETAQAAKEAAKAIGSLFKKKNKSSSTN